MNPDRRDRLSDLYHAAQARPPAERSAFLRDASDGDDVLRREVESLRFTREARLLATLNQPHIGVIYGLEETDGVTALARARRRPDAGRVPGARAGAGSAGARDRTPDRRGFAAAHEKGIVHRDLKPANIVVQGAASGAGHGSDDVRVKVLDFGCELPDRPLLRAVRPGK